MATTNQQTSQVCTRCFTIRATNGACACIDRD